MLLILSLISCITLAVICYTANRPVASWVYSFPLPCSLALNIQPAVREHLGNAGSLEKCIPDCVWAQYPGNATALFNPGQGRWCLSHTWAHRRCRQEQLCPPGPSAGQQWAGTCEIKWERTSARLQGSFPGISLLPACVITGLTDKRIKTTLEPAHWHWEGFKPCHTVQAHTERSQLTPRIHSIIF